MKDYLKRIYSDYLYYRFKHLYEKDPRLAAYALYDRIYGNHDDFDIDNPKSLIEIITWLELYSDTSLWTICADKYRMREYVSQVGLDAYLPVLYGQWDNPDDIDFSTLPKEFVLKANNGCGTVMIVRDKDSLCETKTRKVLKKWIKHKFGYMGAQKHYLSIKPCIIAEELLHQGADQKLFSPSSMVDYKVWCINGTPESILVTFNRNSKNYNIDLYNTEWESIAENIDISRSEHNVYNADIVVPKPKCLAKLLELAAILAKPFPEVRVDFYIVNDMPVIGELTFSTGYGYFKREYYDYLGSKITLSNL